MGDVDHFKSFNDTHGHQAGDHVLREVARLWKAVMPDDAVLARYGGEEFICALPGSGQDRGRQLGEVLRKALESHPLSFEGKTLSVTSSFGVAQFGPGCDSGQELVRLADEALYAAKEAGRNRVVCSRETSEEAIGTGSLTATNAPLGGD
jgi:diguanylate cyclase (GGDEF)-like protein